MSVYSLNIYHFAPSQNWFSSICHGPYILLPTFSLLLVNLLKLTWKGKRPAPSCFTSWCLSASTAQHQEKCENPHLSLLLAVPLSSPTTSAHSLHQDIHVLGTERGPSWHWGGGGKHLWVSLSTSSTHLGHNSRLDNGSGCLANTMGTLAMPITPRGFHAAQNSSSEELRAGWLLPTATQELLLYNVCFIYRLTLAFARGTTRALSYCFLLTWNYWVSEIREETQWAESIWKMFLTSPWGTKNKQPPPFGGLCKNTEMSNESARQSYFLRITNISHFPSRACTALHMYCMLYTLSDSCLPPITDFRLYGGANLAALSCVLLPLLLWKYFPPATTQQSRVFLWTGFDGAGEGKSPSHCAGLGTGTGQDSPAPLLSPTGDSSASCWGSQNMDRAQQMFIPLQFRCLLNLLT